MLHVDDECDVVHLPGDTIEELLATRVACAELAKRTCSPVQSEMALGLKRA